MSSKLEESWRCIQTHMRQMYAAWSILFEKKVSLTELRERQKNLTQMWRKIWGIYATHTEGRQVTKLINVPKS